MKNGQYTIRKRLMALILSILMINQILPLSVLAEAGEVVSSEQIEGVSYSKVTFRAVDEQGKVKPFGKTRLVQTGSAIGKLPNTPTRKGYVFTGWYVDGVKIDANYIVRGSLEIIGRYEPKSGNASEEGDPNVTDEDPSGEIEPGNVPTGSNTDETDPEGKIPGEEASGEHESGNVPAESDPDETDPEGKTPGEVASGEHESENVPAESGPDETNPEGKIPDEDSSDETVVDVTTTDEETPSEDIPEEVIPVEVIPEGETQEETTPDEEKTDEGIPVEGTAEGDTQEKDIPEEEIPEGEKQEETNLEPADVVNHTVIFTAFGETIESRQIAEGEAVGEFPEAPVREGYTFHHWVITGQGGDVSAATIVYTDLEIAASYTCDYPATYLRGMGNEWSVSVNVPEGALPETTLFRVVPVSGENYRGAVESALGGSVKNITAVDLFFVDLFNRTKEIEPLKPVTVHVSIPGLDNSATHSVVHIKESGEAEVVQRGVTGSNFTFEADQFSIYVVQEDKIVTVNFYDKDGNLITNEYIKQNSDGTVQELYSPSFTLSYGESFYGWATEENASSGKTISELNTEIGNSWSQIGDQLNYYAVVKKVYVIRYQKYDSNGKIDILETVEIPTDAENKSHEILGDLGSDAGSTFVGWMAQDGTVYEQGKTITVTNHLDLYLKETGRYWLVFDANAGGPGSGVEYIPPQLIFGEGKVTVKPEDPERLGYYFKGWNTKADGTGEWWYKTDGSVTSKFGGTLSGDITLFAQWEGAPTSYHVVFWQQDAGDEAGLTDNAKHYNYVGGYEVSEGVLTGDTVAITDTDTSYEHKASVYLGANPNSIDFSHYHWNESKTDNSKIAASDGTTTLNVYYDLDMYTLKFQIYDYAYTETTGNSEPQYGFYNGEYVPIYRSGNKWYRTKSGWLRPTYSNPYNGPRYTRSQGWQTIKEIYALVGHNISGNFPIVGTNGVTYDNGERWEPQGSNIYNQVLVFIDVMPAENIVFHLNKRFPNLWTITHFVA